MTEKTINYSALLSKNFQDKDMSKICVIVSTKDFVYPFSFIEYEDDNFLAICYTDDEFSERFLVINKKYVVSVGLMYQQDLEFERAEPNSYYM